MLQSFKMEGKVTVNVRKGRGGARPRSGPKPKPVTEHRRNRIMLNFTDAELQALARAAGAKGITVFARELVLQALARRS